LTETIWRGVGVQARLFDAHLCADLADAGEAIDHRVSESDYGPFSSVTWTAGNRNCGGTQMKQAYRVLAFLVAAGVALQAAAISYGMFGLIKWVEQGGTLDQSTELTPALGG